MTRLLMMVLLPAVFAMPAVPGELFHASENIAEIASYVEAHLMAIVFPRLTGKLPYKALSHAGKGIIYALAKRPRPLKGL